jgi:hypothetical protein
VHSERKTKRETGREREGVRALRRRVYSSPTPTVPMLTILPIHILTILPILMLAILTIHMLTTPAERLCPIAGILTTPACAPRSLYLYLWSGYSERGCHRAHPVVLCGPCSVRAMT